MYMINNSVYKNLAESSKNLDIVEKSLLSLLTQYSITPVSAKIKRIFKISISVSPV